MLIIRGNSHLFDIVLYCIGDLAKNQSQILTWD